MRAILLALLFVGTALTGCIGTGDEAVDPASLEGAMTPAAPVASYLHDLSEPIPGVDVVGSDLFHFAIEAVDGITLDTWVVVPPVDGPVPLVLEVTPYYGGGSPITPLGIHTLGRLADELVPRGYAVGVSSVRGTGNSGGCFSIGGAQEAKDTATVIETLAAEPWSNGNVGLIGVSYPGTTPQDVWVEAPPSLKTVVPIAGISDLYKYNFINGVPIDIQGFGFNTYYWVMVGLAPAGLGGGTIVTDPVSVPGAVIGEACTEQIAVQEGGVSSTLDGNKDAYWQERDFLAELRADWDKPRASVFYIHGLQDWNVKPHNMEDWLPAIQETGVPYKIMLGQWGHAWPQSTNKRATCDTDAACRNDWWTGQMVAWFDQWLKGIDTGIMDAPAVQVQDDDMMWRHETSWPPLDVDPWTLNLGDGVLGEEPGTGDATYHDYMGDVRQAVFVDVDAKPFGPDRVEFVSSTLDEDLRISGQVVFEGDVTAVGERASLVFTLVERSSKGDRAFGFGVLSLNHNDDLANGKGDVSGVRQHVVLRFIPQDDVVHKGNKLVLVASGNTVGGPGPSIQPVSDGGEITLHLEGATLTLPIDRTLVFEDPQPYDDAK